MKNVAESKFKKPMILTLLVILVIAVVLILNSSEHEHSEQDHKTELLMQTEHNLHNHVNHSAVADKKDASSSKDAMPRHQDMLTEEMKQGIRDKLFFHGPKEVIQHPDGRMELPSNGRFTQMPVAVKMPDGTIQIKEYSSIPE